MKKYFWILIVLSLFVTESIISQEEITFDGYWWSTLNWWQKLGYVQGCISAANYYLPLAYSLMNYIADGNVDFVDWRPFDKSFGYYIERIDGYYKTTKDLKKLTILIMNDLIKPISK